MIADLKFTYKESGLGNNQCAKVQSRLMDEITARKLFDLFEQFLLAIGFDMTTIEIEYKRRSED